MSEFGYVIIDFGSFLGGAIFGAFALFALVAMIIAFSKEEKGPKL